MATLRMQILRADEERRLGIPGGLRGDAVIMRRRALDVNRSTSDWARGEGMSRLVIVSVAFVVLVGVAVVGMPSVGLRAQEAKPQHWASPYPAYLDIDKGLGIPATDPAGTPGLSSCGGHDLGRQELGIKINGIGGGRLLG